MVEPVSGVTLTPDLGAELIEFCRDKLARYNVRGRSISSNRSTVIRMGS